MDIENCLVCGHTMKKLIDFPNGKSVFKCSFCGLRSLRPLPDEKELSDYYNRSQYYLEDMEDLHKDLSVNYDEGAPIIRLYQRHLNKIFSLKPPPAKLLEIGCARGVFLDLARKKDYHVKGIDMSQYAVDYAREKFQLDVEKKSIDEIHRDEEKYDIIVAIDVIEHLSSPLDLIERARAMLNPSGLLFLGTPNSQSFIGWISEKLGVFSKGKQYYPAFRFYGRGFEHLNIFNPVNMKRILEKFSFELKLAYGYNIPLENMCDVDFFQKCVIKLVTLAPYEFVFVAQKT